MKFKINIIIFIILLILAEVSCSKKDNTVKPIPLSSMTIINASIGASPIVANFSDSPVQWFSTAQPVGYGSFFAYTVPSGNSPLSISQITDTAHAIFNSGVSLKPAGIYSLFLTGELLQNGQAVVDTLFTQDDPPYHPVTDTSVGIRFVNLSPGSAPVSVNLEGDPNGSEVSSLAYKGITAFKIYPAPLGTQYTFEIRDASTGDLFATYTYYTAPFQNITIALIGQQASADAPLSAIQINNF